VAKRFFPNATAAGLASGLGYADALSAGPVLGAHGEPLVLTDPHTMTAATGAYIRAGIRQLHVFGGTAAVTYDPGSSLSAASPNARRHHLAVAHHDRSRSPRARRSWWQRLSEFA
jgi:hypothetical protein